MALLEKQKLMSYNRPIGSESLFDPNQHMIPITTTVEDRIPQKRYYWDQIILWWGGMSSYCPEHSSTFTALTSTCQTLVACTHPLL